MENDIATKGIYVDDLMLVIKEDGTRDINYKAL